MTEPQLFMFPVSTSFEGTGWFTKEKARHYRCALHEQLEITQCQMRQAQSELIDFKGQCEALHEHINGLQRDHETVGIALDQARSQQEAAIQDLSNEKKKRAVMEATLQIEIRTLWKLVEELRPVQLDTGQLVTVKQLFQSYQNQQQVIEKLNAAVGNYEAIIQQSNQAMKVSDDEGGTLEPSRIQLQSIERNDYTDTQEPEDDGDSSEEADEQVDKKAGKTQDCASPVKSSPNHNRMCNVD
ncbi:hypothetical protein AJ80_09490 [Polytolypa hystricis UAMH7299]|uniref:Uncharacterized protein n=1 Tax=Polytolypa hystricis (strain UAMH7299) TaxID=1447883 RepID=A0A2B7WH40_POLH7|nr:hypothetical protein AJ80_09490 [Polytolypa hystricis UAMH7299]